MEWVKLDTTFYLDAAIVRGGVRFPMVPASKTAAGRELDGRTWDEYPQAVSHA